VGQYQSALQDYDKAIQLPPKGVGYFNYAIAYNNRGMTYVNLGQYGRAIQDYDDAIRIEPTALRYNNRGLAYRRLGADMEADADKAKACSLDSKYC
jgi:tetratricopeptide (TPR) repeat protein